MPLDGVIITGDAIFTQREICQYIRDENGHYLFVVINNQPALNVAISEAFGLDDDRCRVRAGAQALSGLRNAAIANTRRTGSSVRKARENFREDCAEAIKAVTGRVL